LEGLKGCVAYAPEVDIMAKVGGLVSLFDRELPGELAFIKSISPIELADRIKSPVLIFNARDDNVVGIARIDAYAQKATGAREGIPAGIAFMRALVKAGP
jgi:hypothetical protein